MVPKRSQNGANINEKSMSKRLRKTDRKNIEKTSKNGAKIDEKSMKNQCRNGRRRRDEKRTFEVGISINISNPRILKTYEQT